MTPTSHKMKGPLRLEMPALGIVERPPKTAMDAGLIAVLLIGACWRLAVLPSIPVILTTDGVSHLALASHLFPPRYDTWFGAWITPGYPMFLWGVLNIVHGSRIGLLAAQAVLGLSSVAAFYLLARECGGRGSAIVAALFVALHPVAVVFEHTVLTETLALSLLGWSLLLAVRAFSPPRAGRAVTWEALPAGGLMGCAALVRPNLVVIPIAVAAAVAVLACARLASRRPDRPISLFRPLFLMLTAAALVLSPWLANNAINHGRYGVVSGVANIGRFIFGLDAEFLSPDDPAFVSLYPELPLKCETEPECGWYVIDRVRRQVGSEYAVDDWAAAALSRAVRDDPASFLRAALRSLFREVGLDGIDGRRDIDEFMNLARDPVAYATSMSAYTAANPRLTPLVRPTFGRTRGIVLWTYDAGWRFRFPFLFILFAVTLPMAVRDTGTLIIGTVIVATLASWAFVMALAGRYLFLLEPLMCVSIVAGARRSTSLAALGVRALLNAGTGARATSAVALALLAVSTIALAPAAARQIAESYRLNTIVALRERRLPRIFASTHLRRVRASAPNACDRASAQLALDALGLEGPKTPLNRVAEWHAACADAMNLLRGGPVTLAESSVAPGWVSQIERDSAHPDERVWHGRYAGGIRAPLTDELLLEPDALYVYEVRLRTNVPVVALYWQSEIGRHLSDGVRYPEWTSLAFVFITPHWDGARRLAQFSPVLALEPGDVWLRAASLHQVTLPAAPE